MMSHTFASKNTRKTTDDWSRHSAGGENAVAIAPPDYGIDFVDHGTAASVPIQRKDESAPAPNRSGMPDRLKAGIESLSGVDMSGVRVHYNSSKPAHLSALAYAQGNDIHLSSGQERHLPHEAWHVVQQKQGRVKPTMLMKDSVPVNNDRGLEREADVMGAKALQMRRPDQVATSLIARASTVEPWEKDPTEASEIPGKDIRVSGTKVPSKFLSTLSPAGSAAVVQPVIADDYKYMNGGKPPRFYQGFAFKHILNAVDSSTTWLKDSKPLNSKGERETGVTNTDRAYAQAMNRFNTTGVSANFDTVLEPKENPPRPQQMVREKGGTVKYHPFPVERAWQFERVDNGNAEPNMTKYEAKITKRLGSERIAKLSATNNDGVVNHWDQTINPLF